MRCIANSAPQPRCVRLCQSLLALQYSLYTNNSLSIPSFVPYRLHKDYHSLEGESRGVGWEQNPFTGEWGDNEWSNLLFAESTAVNDVENEKGIGLAERLRRQHPTFPEQGNAGMLYAFAAEMAAAEEAAAEAAALAVDYDHVDQDVADDDNAGDEDDDEYDEDESSEEGLG
jgi:hypothetical protein